MDAELERMKGHLAFLWQIIGYYKVLYNDAETVDFLNKVSPDFFRSFQVLCWDRFVLTFSSLIDGDERVESIVNFDKANREALDDQKSAKMDQLLTQLRELAKPFLKARNNIIAHTSVKAAEMGAIYFTIADAERIWLKAVECLSMYGRDFEVILKGGLQDTGPGARALLNYLRVSRLLEDRLEREGR